MVRNYPGSRRRRGAWRKQWGYFVAPAKFVRRLLPGVLGIRAEPLSRRGITKRIAPGAFWGGVCPD